MTKLHSQSLLFVLQLFVRRLLDRLKVIPRVFRREEYKTALNPVINEAYDDAQKENLTSILQVYTACGGCVLFS